MATFHRMKSASGREVIRCFVQGAPDQLLARAATVADADAGPAQADGAFRRRYLAENQRLGEQGLRVIATARKDLDPAAFDPGADLLPLVTGLEPLALAGIVGPPRPRRQGIDRGGDQGRHPGPDDHRRLARTPLNNPDRADGLVAGWPGSGARNLPLARRAAGRAAAARQQKPRRGPQGLPPGRAGVCWLVRSAPTPRRSGSGRAAAGCAG